VKIKRSKYDDIFSKCVRERAHWHCESCGTWYGDNKGALQCSHYWSRRNYSTRFDPFNAVAQCFACHSRDGLHYREYIRIFGLHHDDPENIEQCITDKHHEIVKRKDYENDEMLAHFRSELKKMEGVRESGEHGYLNFTGWI
jgi:hypothetical protein